jgi:hypothetical protein
MSAAVSLSLRLPLASTPMPNNSRRW